MELHQLRYIRAVVRLGSVTAAAETEHVSQPSISKQIKGVERELGLPLFHRVGRRVLPTEAGLAVADCADRVLGDISATLSSLSGSPAAASLRVCATETVADNLLPPAMAALRERYSEVRIRVEMLGTDDAVARVLADDFDFAVVVLPLADSRLEVESLLIEEVLLAVPPAHPFARRTSVSMDEALAEPTLILSMPGHGLRAMVDAHCATTGTTVTAHLELRSMQAILAMVASGSGIAFAPAMSLRGQEGVAGVPLSPPTHRSLGWVRRKGRHIPPVGWALLELLAPPA
ncbi:hypothetical protein AYO38_00280 [bacterium SCGC AG-212-C10]|nr:hypothetical protein AYO38_00280 [bacterium SCGC AG-212-C10]